MRYTFYNEVIDYRLPQLLVQRSLAFAFAFALLRCCLTNFGNTVMTFNELLQFVLQHSKYPLAQGDVHATLEAALQERHHNSLVGHVIAQMYSNSGLTSPEGNLDRAQAIKALGPIRLYYMKDDAPVEGFRLVEDIVHKIDGAYNDEALRLK